MEKIVKEISYSGEGKDQKMVRLKTGNIGQYRLEFGRVDEKCGFILVRQLVFYHIEVSLIEELLNSIRI